MSEAADRTKLEESISRAQGTIYRYFSDVQSPAQSGTKTADSLDNKTDTKSLLGTLIRVSTKMEQKLENIASILMKQYTLEDSASRNKRESQLERDMKVTRVDPSSDSSSNKEKDGGSSFGGLAANLTAAVAAAITAGFALWMGADNEQVKNAKRAMKDFGQISQGDFSSVAGTSDPKSEVAKKATADSKTGQRELLNSLEGLANKGLGALNAIAPDIVPERLRSANPVKLQEKYANIAAKDPEFAAEMDRVAKKYNVNRNDLYGVMDHESAGTFSPGVKNKTSGATGLIQFMPNTAKELGTTTSELAKMTRAEQMKYVDKYFKGHGLGKVNSPTLDDLYMTVFTPAAVGKSADTILYDKNSKKRNAKGLNAYDQNSGMDTRTGNNDGLIQVREVTQAVRSTMNRAGQFVEGTDTAQLSTVVTPPKIVTPPSNVASQTDGGIMVVGGGSSAQPATVSQFLSIPDPGSGSSDDYRTHFTIRP